MLLPCAGPATTPQPPAPAPALGASPRSNVRPASSCRAEAILEGLAAGTCQSFELRSLMDKIHSRAGSESWLIGAAASRKCTAHIPCHNLISREVSEVCGAVRRESGRHRERWSETVVGHRPASLVVHGSDPRATPVMQASRGFWTK